MTQPFDLGAGRNGPGEVPMLGQRRAPAAAPYRVDMAGEDFQAVGDVIVVCLAAAREQTHNGIHLAPHESPYHVVMSVGGKVAGVCDVVLEPGDIVVIEGGRKVETTAGTLWFVRASHILSVVTEKMNLHADTIPPPRPEPDEEADQIG